MFFQGFLTVFKAPTTELTLLVNQVGLGVHFFKVGLQLKIADVRQVADSAYETLKLFHLGVNERVTFQIAL